MKNKIFTGLLVMLLATIPSSHPFAQSKIDTTLLMGNWEFKTAGMRCKQTTVYNKDGIDHATLALSFQPGQRFAARNAKNLPPELSAIFSPYFIKNDEIHFLPEEKRHLESSENLLVFKVKKLSEHKLKLIDEFSIEDLENPGKSLDCTLTIIYQRPSDFSKVLNITKVGDFWIENTEVLNAHWLEYENYHRSRMDSATFADT
ncbi:MAG: hypothetical protein AAFO69_19210, partial [Bacteroidota bacterium]